MNLIEADQMAHSILARYQVPNTVIEWDNSRSRLGVCKFSRNRATGVISKRVILSRVLFRVLSTEEQINTITHEIAHARLPHAVGHGPEWKALHRSMGGDGNPVYRSTETARAVAKWLGKCAVDRRVVASRNRLTDSARTRVCSCHYVPVKWESNA